MKRTNLIALGIVVICILVSLTIAMAAFEQSKNLTAAQKSLKDYNEKMSQPVDALDPLSTKVGASLGELVIPKLGVNCTIRSDTVNAYNAVYHYPESAMPGQPRECGILGHRTTYSGLFENICSLKVVDTLIIVDNIMKKKYNYSVTSN